MNKSKERAYQIIDYHIDKIKKTFGLLKSVILVGSLSDDTYTGNAGSDIDLIHVLNNDAPTNARDIVRDSIIKTEEETSKDIPISKCVYFYEDLFPPYKTNFELNETNKDMVELPLEIFRLKDSGKIIYGEDIVKVIPLPTKDDVLTFHNIAERWNKIVAEQDPERYEAYLQTVANLPTRLIAQIVLTGAMSHYYFYTGNNCSSKAAIYEKIKTSIPDYRFLKLLELSHQWRFDPDNIAEKEKILMMNEYKIWYTLRMDIPYDYVPIERV